MRKVVFNASTSAESRSSTLAEVRKVVFNTSIGVESGFATLTQVQKWFSMPEQVWKVVLQH